MDKRKTDSTANRILNKYFKNYPNNRSDIEFLEGTTFAGTGYTFTNCIFNRDVVTPKRSVFVNCIFEGGNVIRSDNTLVSCSIGDNCLIQKDCLISSDSHIDLETCTINSSVKFFKYDI
jgi:hypothetical protein